MNSSEIKTFTLIEKKKLINKSHHKTYNCTSVEDIERESDCALFKNAFSKDNFSIIDFNSDIARSWSFNCFFNISTSASVCGCAITVDVVADVDDVVVDEGWTGLTLLPEFFIFNLMNN